MRTTRIQKQFEWGREPHSPQLCSNSNIFAILSRVVDNLDNGDMLREVTIKIGLKRINTQERVTVEALLDSRVIGLVMSSEFTRK